MPNLPAPNCSWLGAALLAVVAAGPLPAVALPEDSQQPIRITTDELTRDEKTGLMVYQGNVELVQGTIRISADRMTVYRIENEGDKIIAEGSPASMQQQRTVDKAPMHAWGDVIEYYRDEERVHLRQNARVEEEGSTVKGDRIDYFITEKLVKAAADQPEAGNRVEVVIPPSRLEE